MYEQRYRRFEIHRSRGKISGVCAWLADKMDWDVTIVRLVTLLSFFIAPVLSLVSYFVAAMLLPSRK